MRSVLMTSVHACFFGVIGLLLGCGGGGGPNVPTGVVSGKVLLDGQPLPGATVIFFEEKSAFSATADTESDGTYTLKYAGGTKIPIGSYKVRVTPKSDSGPPPAAGGAVPAGDAAPIPEVYRKFETSKLTAEVKPEPVTVDLALKKG